MTSVCYVAYAAMVCDLDKTVGRTCILRSPLTADTFSWTCMLVQYELSSQDVNLTLDLLADDESIASYILLANERAEWIRRPDVGSSISLQLTASRYLTSAKDYEYAVVSSIAFLPCPDVTSKLLCACVLVTYINRKINNCHVTHVYK